MHEVYQRGRCCYGSPRIHRALRRTGPDQPKEGRRLMQEEGSSGRHRRRFKHTTDSNHGFPLPRISWPGTSPLPGRQPALGWRHHRIAHPEGQALPGGDPRPVLALPRRLGAQRGERPAPHDSSALDMAIRRRCPGDGLLHHSDRGSTYASEDYQASWRSTGSPAA